MKKKEIYFVKVLMGICLLVFTIPILLLIYLLYNVQAVDAQKSYRDQTSEEPKSYMEKRNEEHVQNTTFTSH